MKNFLISIFLAITVICPVSAKDLPDKLSESQVIIIMKEHNLELIALQKQLTVARAEVIIAGSSNNPYLLIEGSSLNPMKLGSTDNQAQYNLGAGYEILLGNQQALNRQIAANNINQTSLDIEKRIREKVAGVKDSYNELLYHYRILKLRELQLHYADELLNISSKQYKGGDVSKYDVYRSELEKNNADRQLKATNREIRISNLDLNILLNLAEDEEIIPADQFKIPAYGEINPDKLAEQAKINDPELNSIKLNLQTQVLKLKLAYGNILPSIGTELSAGNQGLNAKIQLPLPVFYRQEGEIQASKANTELLKSQFTAREKAIALEVKKAYQQYILTKESVKTFETVTLIQAKNLRELALNRLKLGEGSILEVLEAEHTQLQNEEDYLKSVFEARKAFNSLQYIIGGNIFD